MDYAKLSHRDKRVLHEAHLRYQREMLRKAPPVTPDGEAIPENITRGVRFRADKRAKLTYAQTFNPAWFTHVRDNTIKTFTIAMADYQAFFARERKRGNPFVK